uniref:Uncharacterized protein n=1 Tax=Nelumbo nucifera TaxID=4432 RepID=A0A822XHS2_NELNU|nr:TPA_asm: hypothetical protein HUJ06_021250 [Nelumbo nucifera]
MEGVRKCREDMGSYDKKMENLHYDGLKFNNLSELSN